MRRRLAMDVPLFQLRERVIDDGRGVLKRIGNAIAGAYQLGLEHPALFAVGESGQFAEIIQTRYHRRLRRVTVGIMSVGANGGRLQWPKNARQALDRSAPQHRRPLPTPAPLETPRPRDRHLFPALPTPRQYPTPSP